MSHLPTLIVDLALILAVAAFTTIIFKRLKQPLVLGYIIAGVLVGSQFSVTPTVADQANVKTLAEIGVIFLLFSLGLEFSFKKLMRVGGAASITAFVEIIFIVLAGYFLGRAMGWNLIDSIFLGGLLASSSTTIILRAFDELGVKTQQFARIVFGVLIVEDIVVILLMVMLPTIAISQQIHGMEMVTTVLKLLFFLALWFLAGIFLLPTFLRKAKKFLDDETLLVLSIGLCLGMVVLATKAGFSAELGAFIMGSIFAETTSAEKVEHVLKPVKDLFGAVFFVSIGMMIDLNAMVEYRWPILWITLLTIFGKLFSTTLGALISGQPLKQAVKVGMSMAQIGEFAFIIATLGLTLGVTSDFIFPVAVGVSAVTTFTTPYMIKFSDPFYNWIVKLIPQRVITTLNKYSSSTQNIQTTSEWKVVLKSYIMIAATNGIIIIAIVLISTSFILPFVNEQSWVSKDVGTGIVWVITLAAMAPFLWAMMTKKPGNQAYKELWVDKKYNRGPLIMVEMLRIILGVILIGLLLDRFFSHKVAILVALPVTVVIMFVFSKRLQKFYGQIENRFLTNLNARERAAEKLAPIHLPEPDSLTPWDVHPVNFKVNPLAPYIGVPLSVLGWREKFGINIAHIKRGDKNIYAPGRNEMIFPYDDISVIGTDEQLQEFRHVIEDAEDVPTQEQMDNIVLQKILVDEHTRLKNLSIRESGIRERANGLVVGIERNGDRILNPDSSEILQWQDILWVVGSRKKLQRLFKPEEGKSGEGGIAG